MKVYISLPIGGALDFDPHRMFESVACTLQLRGLEPLVPSDQETLDSWTDSLRGTSFLESSVQLVERELGLIYESDALLAILPQPSIGVAMEIAYAKAWGKPVVVVTTLGMLYHPWIWYHADKVLCSHEPFSSGVLRAADELLRLLGGGQR